MLSRSSGTSTHSFSGSSRICSIACRSQTSSTGLTCAMVPAILCGSSHSSLHFYTSFAALIPVLVIESNHANVSVSHSYQKSGSCDSRLELRDTESVLSLEILSFVLRLLLNGVWDRERALELDDPLFFLCDGFALLVSPGNGALLLSSFFILKFYFFITFRNFLIRHMSFSAFEGICYFLLGSQQNS